MWVSKPRMSGNMSETDRHNRERCKTDYCCFKSKALVSSSLILLAAFYLLNSCHNVASLSIFHIYFHANSPLNLLTACLLPSHIPTAHDSTLAHSCSIQISYARVGWHLHSFIPSAPSSPSHSHPLLLPFLPKSRVQ